MMSGARSARRLRLPVYLCVLGVVAAAVGYIAISQVGVPTSSARSATEIVTAQNGVVQTSVSGTGNVAAGTDDEVDFATSGTLKHVYVHQGEHVAKGQILATLDPISAQLTLDQVLADLTSADETLSAADGSSSTTTTSTTATTSTTSAATVDADEIAVENDEQTAKSDKLALAETTLRAPASGTIVSLEDLYPGDSVSAGSASSDSSSGSSSSTSASTTSSSSATSSFAEIVNTSTLTMTVAISEGDIGEIKVGQPATVTIDALTGAELAAHVATVSSSATDSDDVVSYDVTLKLDQTDSRVLSGMSASAAVIVDQADGVTVPSDAVSGSGSEGTVTIEDDGKRVQRQVVVGLRSGTRTEIVSGIKAGQELVVTETLPSVGSTTAATTTGSSSGTLGGSSGLSGAATAAAG
jgi:membrane fusion protein, macrolide-specific efflux system